MRVICIKGVNAGDIAFDEFDNQTRVKSNEEIYEGHYYTVTDSAKFPDGLYYMLLEKPKHCIYNAANFAPTSEIDEMEIYSERQTKELILL